MFRLDCSQGHGFRLILYVKNCFQSSLYVDLMNVGFNESLGCQFSLQTCDLRVGLCYRATDRCPSSSVADDDLLIIYSLDQLPQRMQTMQLMLMGDFNFPAVDFNQNTVHAGPTELARC